MIIISISANSLVITHLYHISSIFLYSELYLHFSKFSNFAIFSAFHDVNFNLGPLYKHYATCLKS